MQLTGKASLNIDSVYVDGENISGVLKLGLRDGELLPIGSKLIISLGDDFREISLSELVGNNADGDFYVEGKEVIGSGDGYGFSGLKISYPDVFFKLKIFDKSEGEVEDVSEDEFDEDSDEVVEDVSEDEEDIDEEDIDEDIESPIQEEASDVGEDVSEEVEEQEEESEEESEVVDVGEIEEVEEQGESLITGEVVKENKKENKKSKKISIDGSCSKDNDFVYELEQGKTAEIEKKSVKVNEIDKKGKEKLEKLDDDAVTLQISGSEVRVSTDYFYEEQGFGEEYLGEKEFLEISLDDLKIKAKDGELKVILVYENTELVDASKMIYVLGEEIEEEVEENETEVEEEIVNETEVEEEIVNETEVEEPEINITIPVNVTINESLVGDITGLNITLKQYKAVIGRPVKWLKKVKVDKTSNDSLVLDLPKSANNISVRTDEEITQAEQEIEDYDELIESVDKTSLITGQVTGEVSLEIKSRKGYLTRFWDWIKDLTITGNVIYEDELSDEIVESVDKKEIDLTNLSRQADEIGVEYYTDAPLAVEENLSYGKKKVVVSADDELNYTDVLAYVVIPNKVKNEDNKNIKIYWWVEDIESDEVWGENENTENITQEETSDVSGEVGGEEVEESEKIESEVVEEINESFEQVEDVNESVIENTENITQEEASDVGESVEGVVEVNESVNESVENFGSLITAMAISENEININSSEVSVNEREGRVVNESKEQNPKKLIKVEVDFSAYDLDEDGYVDYVEWVVPHLSEQVYEIIYITKAEHLDSNRSFVSDIYDRVKEKDNNWSEVINEGEYVRVTFEKELDKTKDITVFGRVVGVGNESNESNVSNGFADIEVYRESSEEVVAVISNISEEGWYKTYLDGLHGGVGLEDNESLDVFDLRVVCEENMSCLGIEFDYIVDPSYTIDKFTISSSIDTNVTQENNFTHLDVSTSAPYDSLVLYMPFDDNASATTTYDYSGEGNDGNIIGGQDADSGFTSSGFIGGAEMFDGNVDYVEVADDVSLDITGNITLSSWVKTLHNSMDYQVIIEKREAINKYNYYSRLDSGYLRFGFYSGTYLSCTDDTTKLDNDKWYYTTITYNKTNIILYLDGVEVKNCAQTASLIADASKLSIGYHDYNNDDYFNGSIDEVMIFNTSLTAEQILDIYNNQSARFKVNGTQELKQFNMSVDYNWLRVTEDDESLMGSDLLKRLGFWNVSKGYNDSLSVNPIDFNYGLVGYWHFDNLSSEGENSTHVKDFSGLGNNGTAVGGSDADSGFNVDDGVYSGGWMFDGVGDYINVSSLSSLETTQTWWAKNSTESNWHYYANSSGTGYVDGATGTINEIVLDNSTTDVLIGNSYSGSLDEVMIFNRSLSASEIKELYIKGRAKFEYTDYQDADSEYFTFDYGSSNFLLDYKFNAGNSTNPFYSPVLKTSSLSPIEIFDNGTELGGCANLGTAGTTYILGQNIIDNGLTGNCMVILASNITLDCQGHYISSTANHSGVYSDQFNTTIKNCNISMGVGSGGYGVELGNSGDYGIINNCTLNNQYNGVNFATSGTDYCTIENSTIGENANTGINIDRGDYATLRNLNISHNSDDGIDIDYSATGIIMNNITVNNNGDDGLATTNINAGSWSITNSTFSFNSDNGLSIRNLQNSIMDNITANNNSNGIYFDSAGVNLIVVNSVFNYNGIGVYFNDGNHDSVSIENSTIYSNTKGIYAWYEASNVILRGLNVSNSGSYGFHSDNTDSNFAFYDSYLEGATNDVKLDSNDNNMTFVNVSYDSESVGSGCELTRKYYYRAYVNDSDSNPVLNANVTAFNVSDDYQFNYSTDATGYTPRAEITEYVNLGGTRNYYNNYSIYADNVSHSGNITYNVSLELNNLESNIEISSGAVADTEYPIFSAYWDNNDSFEDSGTGLFNVTITSTNGTVWLEINNTNITAFNETADVYNASHSFAVGDVYDYRWHSWGNGSSNNYNVSDERSYSVNDSAPNVNIIYPLNINYTINVTELNYTYADAGGVGYCWYSFDNGVVNSSPVNAGVNWTGLSGTDGSNIWTLYCNDSSNNLNSTNISFYSTVFSKCGNLTQVNLEYNLQNDITGISGTCFNITANNVTLNFNGKAITSSGYTDIGVNVVGYNDTTITSGGGGPHINGFENGIFMQNSHNNYIEGIIVSDANSDGVYWTGVTNTTISGGNYDANGVESGSGNGLYADSNCVNNTISITSMDTNSDAGLEYAGHNSTISGGSFDSNDNGIIVTGNNNLINGVDSDSNSVSGIDVSGSNNTIKDSTFDGSGGQTGIYLAGTNITIDGCSFIGEGIVSTSGTFFTISDNVFEGSGYDPTGIYLTNTNYSKIFRNILNQSSVAIYIDSSSNNSFSNNTINSSSSDAITISGAGSDNNNFTNITIINTAGGFSDVNWITAGISGTYLIDMPHIGNYTFTGAGGIINIKDSTYGVINYLNSVNGTGTNLTNDIRIGNNSVVVESGSNEGLNVSANIALYGIGDRGYAIPVILRDGTNICNTTTTPSCWNFTALTASTVLFNVSSWSNYSVGESPDTTVPNVTINYPTSYLNTTSTSINFNVTALDETLMDSCWFTLNNGVTNYTMINSTANDDYNYTNTSIGDGNYLAYFYCNDSSNNINNSESVNFTVDTSAPGISIEYPTNNSNHTNTELNINYTASDSGSGLDSCWYSNDTYTTNTTLADCKTNITDVVWTEGNHNVTIWVNDSAGNENSSSVSFTIDTTPPYFDESLTNQTITYNTGLSYNINASDSGVGLDSYAVNDTTNFKINSSGNLENNTILEVALYWINITINDTLNNLNSSVIYINVTQATGSINGTINGTQSNFTAYNGTATMNIFLNSTNITGYGNCLIYFNGTLYNNGTCPVYNQTNLSVGLYNVTFVYEGNTNYSSDTEVWWVNNTLIVVDTTNPDLTIIYPPNNTNTSNNNLNINYTASDNIALDSCWYSNDTYTTNTTLTDCETNITDVTWIEGNHNVTIWVNDSSNNINSSSITFTIDTTAPNISIETPTNNSNSSNTGININYTTSDSYSELSTCWYSNDTYSSNTTLTDCETNITDVVWSEGNHNVTIWVNDTLNNINSSTITFTIDTTPPDLTIIYPPNNTNTSNNNLNINYTASDNIALDSCWYSNDSYSSNTTLTNCSTNITSVVWVEGKHNVTIWVNDSVGNENLSSVVFRVDNVAPSFDNLRNFTHLVNTSFSNLVTVSDSGIGVESYVLNDTTYFNINSSTGLISNTTNLSRIEIYWLNISVNDSLGNLVSGLFYINVSEDATAPVVSLISPANSVSYTSNSILIGFSYNVSDVNNVNNCSLIINGAISVTNNSINKSASSLSFSQTFTPGTYNWNVNCSDNTGNIGNSSVRSFVISAPAPTAIPGTSSSSGGGGGGGGVDVIAKEEFSVDTLLIETSTKQGESLRKNIIIKNTENKAQNFGLSISESLKELVFISETNFTLQADEEKIVYLNFFSTKETTADTYAGNIKIKTISSEKKILIIHSVMTREALFDINLDVPIIYKEVSPGGELFFHVTLINLGEIGKVDVSIEYLIKDFEGDIVSKKQEMIAVETQASLSRTMDIPLDTKIGDYLIIANVKYGSSVGTSNVSFKVTSPWSVKNLLKNNYLIISLIVVCLFIISFVLLKVFRRKKKVGKRKRKRKSRKKKN